MTQGLLATVQGRALMISFFQEEPSIEFFSPKPRSSLPECCPQDYVTRREPDPLGFFMYMISPFLTAAPKFPRKVVPEMATCLPQTQPQSLAGARPPGPLPLH